MQTVRRLNDRRRYRFRDSVTFVGRRCENALIRALKLKRQVEGFRIEAEARWGHFAEPVG
jgi:hypothetical protein